MARHTTVGRHLRMGVVALLGAGLLAPALDGALHGSGAPTVTQASAAISAEPATAAGDNETRTPEPSESPEATRTPAPSASPEPSASADRSYTTGGQNHTSKGSHSRDGGSDDEGVSDDGVVHDGQSGQKDESEVELHHEETNHVNAGSNTFSDDTTAAESVPEVDQ